MRKEERNHRETKQKIKHPFISFKTQRKKKIKKKTIWEIIGSEVDSKISIEFKTIIK